MNLANKYRDSTGRVLSICEYVTQDRDSFENLLNYVSKEIHRLNFAQVSCDVSLDDGECREEIRYEFYDRPANLIYDVLPTSAQGSHGVIKSYRDYFEMQIIFRPGWGPEEEERLYRFKKGNRRNEHHGTI